MVVNTVGSTHQMVLKKKNLMVNLSYHKSAKKRNYKNGDKVNNQ